MSHPINDAPVAVKGEVIQPPIARAWLFVGLAIVSMAVGLGTIGLGGFEIWSGESPPIRRTAGMAGLGLLLLVIGVVIFRFGLWQIKDRPRWIIGADQLQFFDRVAGVRLAIPYTNLAAVELCAPAGNAPPFIGLRLVYPDLIKSYATTLLLTSDKMHELCGYHWRISEQECEVALPIVLAKIQARFQQWQALASRSSAALPAPNPDTAVTPTPPVQQNFM